MSNQMAETEKFEHWSGDEVSFSYEPRVEAFPSVEDATEALLAQHGGDREAFLKDLLNQYNAGIRWAARREAVASKVASLGIDEDQEDLFKSLVSAIRTKLDAKDKNPGNLKIARQKALVKIQSLSLADV